MNDISGIFFCVVHNQLVIKVKNKVMFSEKIKYRGFLLKIYYQLKKNIKLVRKKLDSNCQTFCLTSVIGKDKK